MKTTVIPSAPVTILTRADHDPGPEWPGAYRSIAIERLAGVRFESREKATLWAAWNWLAQSDTTRTPTPLMVWTLLHIDRCGVGGPTVDVAEAGASTARMSWAHQLGSGRRHARDGGAYGEALDWAIKELELEFFNQGVFEDREFFTDDPNNPMARGPRPEDVEDLISNHQWRALATGGQGHRDIDFVVRYCLHRMMKSNSPEMANRWHEVAALAANETSLEVDNIDLRWELKTRWGQYVLIEDWEYDPVVVEWDWETSPEPVVLIQGVTLENWNGPVGSLRPEEIQISFAPPTPTSRFWEEFEEWEPPTEEEKKELRNWAMAQLRERGVLTDEAGMSA